MTQVQRVEALLKALEKAGIVLLEHASAQEMVLSKMAVSIRDIHILDNDRWVLEMNKVRLYPISAFMQWHLPEPYTLHPTP